MSKHFAVAFQNIWIACIALGLMSCTMISKSLKSVASLRGIPKPILVDVLQDYDLDDYYVTLDKSLPREIEQARLKLEDEMGFISSGPAERHCFFVEYGWGYDDHVDKYRCYWSVSTESMYRFQYAEFSLDGKLVSAAGPWDRDST